METKPSQKAMLMAPILSAFCGETTHLTELKCSHPIDKNQFSCQETQGIVSVKDIWPHWQDIQRVRYINHSIF